MCARTHAHTPARTYALSRLGRDTAGSVWRAAGDGCLYRTHAHATRRFMSVFSVRRQHAIVDESPPNVTAYRSPPPLSFYETAARALSPQRARCPCCRPPSLLNDFRQYGRGNVDQTCQWSYRTGTFYCILQSVGHDGQLTTTSPDSPQKRRL